MPISVNTSQVAGTQSLDQLSRKSSLNASDVAAIKSGLANEAKSLMNDYRNASSANDKNDLLSSSQLFSIIDTVFANVRTRQTSVPSGVTGFDLVNSAVAAVIKEGIPYEVTAHDFVGNVQTWKANSLDASGNPDWQLQQPTGPVMR